MSGQPGYRYSEQVGGPRPEWAWVASDPVRASRASEIAALRPDLSEKRLLGAELLLLVESSDGGRGDLVQLETEKADRADQHTRIATELGEAGVYNGELAPGLRDLLEVGSGEAVERVTLRGWCSNDWWTCWPCRSTRPSPISDSDDAGAMRPSNMHASARPQGPTETARPLASDDESPFDDSLRGAGPNDCSIGPTSEQ